MADLEKVIQGLRRCFISDDCTNECTYVNVKPFCSFELKKDVLEMLREQSEIVRCKDCKYLIDHYGFMDDGYCKNMRETYYLKFKPEDNWFCADGERK